MFIPKAAARSAVARAIRPKPPAEGGARNVMSQQQFRFPPGELPGSGELVGFDGSPCGCQDEQHREIGGGVGEDAGSVTDDDVVSGCGCYVDVVVADGIVGDSAYFASASKSASKRSLSWATTTAKSPDLHAAVSSVAFGGEADTYTGPAVRSVAMPGSGMGWVTRKAVSFTAGGSNHPRNAS